MSRIYQWIQGNVPQLARKSARKVYHETFHYKAKKSDPIRAAYVAAPVLRDQTKLSDADEDEHTLPSLVIPENVIRQKEKFYYAVRVVTGTQAGAGDIILAATYVSLVGDKGEVKDIRLKDRRKTCLNFISKYWTNLDKSFCSAYDDIVIESDKDLGEIQVVHARLHSKFKAKYWFEFLAKQNWFIAYFTVANETGARTDFPCYHWVGQDYGDIHKHVTATSKTTTLKHVDENEILKKQRSDLLDKRRKVYKWRKFTSDSESTTYGLPSCIDTTVNQKELPIDEQFEWAKKINFNFNGFQGIYSTFGSAFKIKMMTLARSLLLKVHFEKGFHDFEFISKRLAWRAASLAGPPRIECKDPTGEGYKQPTCYEGHRWATDVEFGRQILNGVNPVVIRKCKEIPDFARVPADVSHPSPDSSIYSKINSLLSSHEDERTRTLEEEIERGRVYICDLREILKDLPTREGYHCAAPVCLLYVNDLQQLIPIAIQLMPNDPVILPSDNWFKWLLAKMHYRAADAQCHQLSSHFLSCHATMEAYCVATMRTIPDAHPVYKLLRPHFHNTLSINEKARNTILKKDGDIAKNFAVGNDGMFELIKRAGSAHHVHWTNIKRSIEERGVENLPGYYYRDDGVLVWDAIETYVTEIIDLFYEDDDEVKNDKEVEKWAEQIHEKAFPKFGDDQDEGHKFPKEIKTKKELIEYCTLIIFTGSAQHAAVNFGQFDTYGFTPNAPIGMREKPPTPSSKITGQNDIMNHLPDMNTAANAANVTYILAQFSPDEIFLGEYPYCWYAEQEARDAVEKFGKKLKELDKKIVERNKKLDVPYYHLRPLRVPNSISI